MRIRVPASSANLGPGFDSFGLAWQLYNEIEVEHAEELRIEGCDARFRGEDNLVWRAYAGALRACGRQAGGAHIRFLRGEIPVSRGLGSSAALIAAGVLAADRLNRLSLGQDELLDLATAVEGHPDNVTPALLGGLTVSLMDGDRAVTRRFPLSDRLRFTLLIPPFELSTALARSVMPPSVRMEDAVFNLSRAALLLRALGDGDGDLLRLALDDRLHQPYRRGLIPGYDAARDAAEALGALGLCISGAGSTLLCFSDREDFPAALQRDLARRLPDWRVTAARPDHRGACAL